MPSSVVWKNINVTLLLIQLLFAHIFFRQVETATICLDSKTGIDIKSCLNESDDCSQPCKSLMFALLGAQGKNSTILHIYDGTYSLLQNSSIADFYGITDLAIIGMSHNVFITCGDGAGGMGFFNCSQISITNVTISGCGALRNSTSKNFSSDAFSFHDFNVTLYFLFCKNVTLTNVTIANSTGTGVVMYATVGVVTIQFCAFLSNNAIASGGGLYIEFPYCIPGDTSCLTSANVVPQEFTAFAFYQIYCCTFDNNAAYSSDDANGVFILPQKSNHLAFGRGGGLSIFFKGCSHHNTIYVSHCNFTNNVALWGGGLLAEHHDFSSNNAFIVDHSFFLQNSCLNRNTDIKNANGTGGGGVRLGLVFFEHTYCINNSFTFSHTTFNRNGAYYGGGLSFYAPREPSVNATNSLEFHNCSWFANSGRLGSAIDLALWHPVITGSSIIPLFNNSIFYNNYYYQQSNQYVGIGALYSDNIPIRFTGETTFCNNSHSAVAGVGSYMHFDINSSTIFRENKGRIGGAMVLLGNAFIVTSYHSVLVFVNNSAALKGGAIYGEIVGEHDLLSSRNCFIRYSNLSSTPAEWKSHFYFRNNTPNAIYATTIVTCVWGGAFGSSVDSNLNSVFNWSNWHYDDGNNEIITAPLQFVPKLNNNDSNNGSNSFCLVPGKRSLLPFEALDDNSRDVTSSLVMTIRSENSSVVTISNYTQYISDNTIIVYGNNTLNSTATLILETIDPKVVYNELSVSLSPCPPGMVLGLKPQDGGNVTQCICGGNGFQGVVKCNSDNFSSSILRGHWMGWVDSQYVVGDCAYCTVSSSIDTSYDFLPDSKGLLDNYLCGRVDRTGILCGNCKLNYGLTANLLCRNCNLYTLYVRVILYIATQFIPVTIFFLILMLFNVNITSGPINSFVFFAQMITTACDITAGGTISIPPKIITAFTTIYEIWNLNFLSSLVPPVCLGEDLSLLQMQSLQYINASYPLCLVAMFFCVLTLYDRGCPLILCICRPVHIFFVRFKRVWNLKGSVINAVAAFFLLSYFKFTSVSLMLLSPAYLYKDDGTLLKAVLYYNGSIDYLDRVHTPYFVLGVFMICIFVAIPPVILMTPSIFRVILKRSGVMLCAALQNSKMEQFLSIFYGCYRNGTERRDFKGFDLRWFSGFYFVLRFSLLIVHAFSPTTMVYMLQQIICTLAILSFALLRPYKNNFLNMIDIVFFANLVVIISLTMYNYLVVTALQQRPSDVVLVIQYLLLLWPVLYLLLLLALYTLQQRIWCGCKTCNGSHEEMGESNEFLIG